MDGYAGYRGALLKGIDLPFLIWYNEANWAMEVYLPWSICHHFKTLSKVQRMCGRRSGRENGLIHNFMRLFISAPKHTQAGNGDWATKIQQSLLL